LLCLHTGDPEGVRVALVAGSTLSSSPRPSPPGVGGACSVEYPTRTVKIPRRERSPSRSLRASQNLGSIPSCASLSARSLPRFMSCIANFGWSGRGVADHDRGGQLQIRPEVSASQAPHQHGERCLGQSGSYAPDTSIRGSSDVKDLRYQGRVEEHVWGKRVVRPDVYPGVACAQCQERLDHTRTEVLQ
jgi:hypothetical protein